MVGNSLAGAGAIDVAFATQAIHSGVVPPTINVAQQDPECKIDLATTARSDAPVDVAVVGTRGAGGSNSAVVLHRAR
jgi:3-oxoacyl-[acyl-carrier-protein] synthase II